MTATASLTRHTATSRYVPFTVAVEVEGQPLTATVEHAAAALAVAHLFLDRHHTTRATLTADPASRVPAEVFAHVDVGSTHCLLLAPGTELVITDRAARVEACCGGQLAVCSLVIDPPEAGRGVPCPMCHTAWAVRYDQITTA